MPIPLEFDFLKFDEINYFCKNAGAGNVIGSVRKRYRVSKVKSHVISYRVNKETVEVIKILHERMDIEERRGE